MLIIHLGGEASLPAHVRLKIKHLLYWICSTFPLFFEPKSCNFRSPLQTLVTFAPVPFAVIYPNVALSLPPLSSPHPPLLDEDKHASI